MLLARRLDGGAARRGGQSLNALAQFRVVALQPAQHLQEPVTGLARQKLCQQGIPACAQTVFLRNLRSEEHTSELQSLMRISYDVFCLKNNTNQQFKTHMPTPTH